MVGICSKQTLPSGFHKIRTFNLPLLHLSNRVHAKRNIVICNETRKRIAKPLEMRNYQIKNGKEARVRLLITVTGSPILSEFK